MKMDRKWIFLAALPALLLVSACAGNTEPAVTPPPQTTERAPTMDVASDTTPAGPVDIQERAPSRSIQELQAEAERSGLLGDVFYDYDKYELRSEARDRLQKNADFMKRNADLQFTIEGHCDERGTNEYNIALGQSRSTSALDYLVSLGVSSRRFKTISYGEERPFCTESTAACWQMNRRARFVISGQS